MAKPFIGVQQLAARLGMTPKSIRAAVGRGDIPARRVGLRGWLKFDPDEVDKALAPSERIRALLEKLNANVAHIRR
jgi:hypothetical protein